MPSVETRVILKGGFNDSYCDKDGVHSGVLGMEHDLLRQRGQCNTGGWVSCDVVCDAAVLQSVLLYLLYVSNDWGE